MLGRASQPEAAGCTARRAGWWQPGSPAAHLGARRQHQHVEIWAAGQGAADGWPAGVVVVLMEQGVSSQAQRWILQVGSSLPVCGREGDASGWVGCGSAGRQGKRRSQCRKARGDDIMCLTQQTPAAHPREHRCPQVRYTAGRAAATPAAGRQLGPLRPGLLAPTPGKRIAPRSWQGASFGLPGCARRWKPDRQVVLRAPKLLQLICNGLGWRYKQVCKRNTEPARM